MIVDFFSDPVIPSISTSHEEFTLAVAFNTRDMEHILVILLMSKVHDSWIALLTRKRYRVHSITNLRTRLSHC